MNGRIVKVSGPLVVADGMRDCRLNDIVYVGEKGLLGEIVELHENRAFIQVYEDTSLLAPFEEVVKTGEPLSIDLAPGLIGGIYDGIARPLDKLSQTFGAFITKGAKMHTLDKDKLWHFYPLFQEGEPVHAGQEIGYVFENKTIKHKILLPLGIDGVLMKIAEGDFSIEDTIAVVKLKDGTTKNIKMLNRWPIRSPRPYVSKHIPTKPLVTGQRVIDLLFPIAKGGIGAVPGPFGSGKTVVQHQIAKWADADIIVYVGCGERGNEMADVLKEFPTIVDPKTGASLMERTILIANTSDMPVPAREASLYTGMTIAEYYRDMGYNVAIMADSTSRYAEALREMSSRLEEMPSEEGYPAYLSSRLSGFYERAGLVTTLSNKKASITAIGAVSPAGGDLTESVSQATLKVVKVFWALSAKLAYIRHFPAIDYSTSYTLYLDNMKDFYKDNYKDFMSLREFVLAMLKEEKEISEIVHLVGYNSLDEEDKLTLATAKMIKEDFLHQNAFDEVDTYTSLEKSCRIVEIIQKYYELATSLLNDGFNFDEINHLDCKVDISTAKMIKEKDLKQFDRLLAKIKEQFRCLSTRRKS